jgi:ribosomal protein S18 acetylase RimI-like enzyme
MTTKPAELTFTVAVYDGSAARDQLDVVSTMYAEVYAEPPYFEGPDDVDWFAKDWPRRVSQPGFRLVLARAAADPAGFAFGHQLKEGTAWWDGALEPLPTDVTEEHTGRTFAVIELAVRKPYRRQGLARALHSALLRDRREERATLLVRPEAQPARQMYTSLGYEPVGRIKPYENAPVYQAMIKTLVSVQLPI